MTSIGADVASGGTDATSIAPRWGKWVPAFRAFVRRWESETARPDFDPYPEEERPGVETPELAPQAMVAA